MFCVLGVGLEMLYCRFQQQHSFPLRVPPWLHSQNNPESCTVYTHTISQLPRRGVIIGRADIQYETPAHLCKLSNISFQGSITVQMPSTQHSEIQKVQITRFSLTIWTYPVTHPIWTQEPNAYMYSQMAHNDILVSKDWYGDVQCDDNEFRKLHDSCIHFHGIGGTGYLT